MIDEVYAMLPHRIHFVEDIMQALLDNLRQSAGRNL
jgi:hypothetical protein